MFLIYCIEGISALKGKPINVSVFNNFKLKTYLRTAMGFFQIAFENIC
jgi:hypothetical protein